RACCRGRCRLHAALARYAPRGVALRSAAGCAAPTPTPARIRTSREQSHHEIQRLRNAANPGPLPAWLCVGEPPAPCRTDPHGGARDPMEGAETAWGRTQAFERVEM